MQPYIGEIQLHAREYDTRGFLPCDGRLLPISDFSLLYAKIGVAFGGDGVTNFALPDLRGRSIVHYSATLPFGTAGGTPTLTPGTVPTLSGTAIAQGGGGDLPIPRAEASNYQPSLGLRYMIAVEGIYPRGWR